MLSEALAIASVRQGFKKEMTPELVHRDLTQLYTTIGIVTRIRISKGGRVRAMQ